MFQYSGMNKILIIITIIIIIIIIIIYRHGGATGHLVIVNRKILTLLKDLRLLLFLGLAWLRWGVSSSSLLWDSFYIVKVYLLC